MYVLFLEIHFYKMLILYLVKYKYIHKIKIPVGTCLRDLDLKDIDTSWDYTSATVILTIVSMTTVWFEASNKTNLSCHLFT